MHLHMCLHVVMLLQVGDRWLRRDLWPKLQSPASHIDAAPPLPQVGGKWLRWWMIAAAAVSQIGQFEAEMSSDSFQLQASAATCKGVHRVRPATVVGLSVSKAFCLKFVASYTGQLAELCAAHLCRLLGL